MSTKPSQSYVISIRVSEAEKRELDILAQKRKRRPSSLAKMFVLQGIEQKQSSKEDRINAFYDFQEKMKRFAPIDRDPQQVIDDIRNFRGNES